jgi:hypothetical protein
MLEKLLDKIRVSYPLVFLIVFSGNIIVVLSLLMKWYSQAIVLIFQSNNYYLLVALCFLILITVTFFSAVELYVGRGIIRWLGRRQQETKARYLIRNLPPLYKCVLRKLMLQPGCEFDEYNPQIASALSDLESLGFIQCGSVIPRTYHIDIEYYEFFRENPKLLDS